MSEPIVQGGSPKGVAVTRPKIVPGAVWRRTRAGEERATVRIIGTDGSYVHVERLTDASGKPVPDSFGSKRTVLSESTLRGGYRPEPTKGS